MHKKTVGVALVAAALLAAALLYEAWQERVPPIEDVLAAYEDRAVYADIALEYPFDGTLFPPEMVPPVFRWKDGTRGSRRWLVRIALTDGQPDMLYLVGRPQWTARPQEWETLKRRALEHDAHVVILGVGRGRSARILSRAAMSFRTSHDPVGAPLFYREVVLPFLKADKDPSRIRWRFGSAPTAIRSTGTARSWRWMPTSPTTKARTSSPQSGPGWC